MTILIGCDPEVLLERDGNIISSIGVIGHGKDDPLEVEEGAVLEDNVLAEINIVPASNPTKFVSSIRKVLRQLTDITKSDIVVKPSHNFTKEYLMSLPEAAMNFGCDIDYNAYTGEANPKPNPWTTLRTAGGHVHVGADNIDMHKLVKTMDLYLGVPSVVLDSDAERRELYGKAGCYRPKDYGVEYRVLSNFWLKSNDLMQWVYERTIKAVNDHKTIEIPENTIINCINNNNVGLAKELCDEYRLV